MRLIKQRTRIDCGIASIAIATGVDYLTIRREMIQVRPNSRRGVSVGNVCDVLEELGFKVDWHKFDKVMHWAAWQELDPGSIVNIRSKDPTVKLGHFVVWDGKQILDPVRGIMSPVQINKHARIDYEITIGK